MRTNADKLDKERQRQLQEIEQIERSIKQWNFDIGQRKGGLEEILEIETNIWEVLEEDNTSIILMEAEKLHEVMVHRHSDITRKLKLSENDLLMLDNEIRNKLIHKMDSEDIRYSIYKKLIAREKAGILQDTVDTYKAIVDSLKGIKELKPAEGKKNYYIPAQRALHSQFYICKVQAKLCYESCFERLMSLMKQQRGKTGFNGAIISEFAMQRAMHSSSSSKTYSF